VDGHACLLPFDTDSAEFVRGFECGRIWSTLRERPDENVEELVHASNVEMVMRMAEATGRPVRSEELDCSWISVTFAPCRDMEGSNL
jgi:hypothetical protein